MAKYKARIQYLGTHYSGWQVQKNRKTVQQVLQHALQRVTGEQVRIVGAGRTDAGVHALGQVAHFLLKENPTAAKLRPSLNGVLPWDIRIVHLSQVAHDFHAQKQAVRKRYRYRIYNGAVLSPMLHQRVWHVRRPLDRSAMQQAARYLIGQHDFSGFAASTTKVQNRSRQIFASRVSRKGNHFSYTVEANGFLHHMVRNVVGTLLQVGLGKRPASDIPAILASRDRRQAGPTAPAHGLYLVKVWYSGNF